MIPVLAQTGQFLFYLAGILLIFGILAPYFPFKAWWTRIWMYGRQQTIILLIVLGADIHLAVWGVPHLFAAGFLIVLDIGCVWCLVEIHPYFPVGTKELPDSPCSNGDRRLSILLLNVLEAEYEVQAALNCIREADADIVLLSETNQAWADALGPLSNDLSAHTSAYRSRIITGCCSIHATLSRP